MVDRETVPRVLTPQDKIVANRLHAIYTRKRQSLGLTQARLAETMGFTNQSTISCYLRGHIALRNAQTLLKFANALEVDPREIDPRFEVRYPHVNEQNHLPLEVCDLNGKPVKRDLHHLGKLAKNHFAVMLNRQYQPLFPARTLVLCDKDSPLKKNALVYVQFTNGGALYNLEAVTRRSATLSLPDGYQPCRDRHRRARKPALDEAALDRFFPTEPIKLPLPEIKSITRVVAFELP